MRVRKNILSLTEDELKKFKAGIYKLKAGSTPKNPGIYDKFAQLHWEAAQIKTPWVDDKNEDKNTRTQPHWGPAFLPWHRIFIYEFEKALGTAMNDDSFGLPYWDWGDEEKMFTIFDDQTLLAYMGGTAENKVGNRRLVRLVLDGLLPNIARSEYLNVGWRQWTRAPTGDWEPDKEEGIDRNPVVVTSAMTPTVQEGVQNIRKQKKKLFWKS